MMRSLYRIVLIFVVCFASISCKESASSSPSTEKPKKPKAADDDDDDPKGAPKTGKSGPKPRTDLNGSLFQKPGDKAVYWIDRGVRRHVVSPAVKARVFAAGVTVHEDKDLEQIAKGADLDEESKLAKCASDPHVYLLDGTTKRHVKNEAAMEANGFNAKKVEEIDCTAPKKIADGASIGD